MLQRVSRRLTVYVALFGCRRLEIVLAVSSRTAVASVAAADVTAADVTAADVTAAGVAAVYVGDV
jgi:hypothetical protein